MTVDLARNPAVARAQRAHSTAMEALIVDYNELNSGRPIPAHLIPDLLESMDRKARAFADECAKLMRAIITAEEARRG